MSAIDTVLVPGCRALTPEVFRNGGTTVYKTGYHGPRTWLDRNYPHDYSIQLPADRQGPGDKGAAFDWTFEDARLKGDFRTIAKFSNRLYQAGKNKDPRAYPLREFFGNIDLDWDVEGWSYYRDRVMTSDKTHLWHIHFSVWRKYINDADAMRSILSILSGEEEDMPTVKEIWTTDDVVPAPPDPATGQVNPDNLYWQPATYLKNLYGRVDTVEKSLGELKAQVAEILDAVKQQPPTP